MERSILAVGWASEGVLAEDGFPAGAECRCSAKSQRRKDAEGGEGEIGFLISDFRLCGGLAPEVGTTNGGGKGARNVPLCGPLVRGLGVGDKESGGVGDNETRRVGDSVLAKAERRRARVRFFIARLEK